MRVLFIHHSGLLGGAGISLLNTAQALQQAGHEVILSIPSEPYDMLNLASERGLTTRVSERRIGAVTYVSGIDRAFSPRFLYRLGLVIPQFGKWNKRIREIDPDVVVVNSKTLCWMSLIPEIKRRRSFCFVRETLRGRRKNLLNVIIARLLDGFAEVSFISDFDRRIERLRSAKTHVVYNYVDYAVLPDEKILAEKSAQWGLSENRFKVLYVGGVNGMKGFHIAAQAVLALGPEAELIAAGNDFADAVNTGNKQAIAYANRMAEFLAENDRYQQIHVVGKQKDMSVCYSLCDALIFPMQSPHQARPAFEVGFFGKPVVISDFENIREFVRDGENGFAAIADSPDDFAQKLRILQENQELRTKIGNCNLKNTLERHSKNVVQQQLVEMIGRE